jgi:hypothetical protein
MSSSTSVVDIVGPAGSAPQGGHHRRLLQPQWWMLPDPLTAPSRGGAIDIFFNLSDGCYRTHRQHPPSWPTINVFLKLGGV